MFTVYIFIRFNYKVFYIKEVNNSISLKNSDIKPGTYFMSFEKICDVLKDEDPVETKKLHGILLNFINKEVSNSKNNNINIYTICMHPSRKCNLGCKYCFAMDGNDYLPKEGISVENAKKAINYLVNDYAKEAKEYRVDISGSGEPLLKFDFIKEISEYCKIKSNEISKEIKIMFPTNATLLNDEIVDFLSSAHNILPGVSIDGDYYHSANRLKKNGENAYNMIDKGIHKLKSSFGIAVTITHINEDVDRVYDYLYYHYPLADSISMQFVRDYDDSETSFYDINMDNVVEHYVKLTKLLYHHIENNDYEYVYKLIRGSDMFGVFLCRSLLKGKVKKRRCGAGVNTISVDDDGKLYACSVMNGDLNFKVGDIQEGIDNALQDKFINANVDNHNKCKKCWAAYICSGECFAKSYLTTGNIFDTNDKMCQLKRRLIEISIGFTEVLKKKQPLAYEKIRRFKIDKSKGDWSLWVANEFLKSRRAKADYDELLYCVQRGEKGIKYSKYIELIKKYVVGIKLYDLTEDDIYKIKMPAIVLNNKNKRFYRYYLLQSIEKGVCKIYNPINGDVVSIELDDFMKNVSNKILSD